MPIDPSIALGVKPIEFQNPINSMTQLMQLQNAQSQNKLADLTFQQHQQSLDENNRLRDYYAKNDPNSPDFARGLMAISPTQGLAYQKTALENKKANIEVDGKTFELASKRADGYKADLGALYQDPTLTKDKAVSRMQARLQQGLITPEMYTHIVSDLPDDPVQLRDQIGQGIKERLTPEQMLTLFAPKTEYKDNGQKFIPVQTNPLAPGYVPPVEIQKVATPGEVMTDNRTRSEGAANRKQALDLANQGVTYQQDGDGNYVALPTKVAPGAKVVGSAVLDSKGVPLQGNKGQLNGDQAKAALYGSRMKQSDAILAELADKGVTTSPIGSGIGFGVGTAITALSSPDKQRLDQAKRNFINATLRRESGAAIAPSEFDNAEKQYFPQLGDSPEVKAQKAANRASAISGMLIEIPKGQRDSVVSEILSSTANPSLSVKTPDGQIHTFPTPAAAAAFKKAAGL